MESGLRLTGRCSNSIRRWIRRRARSFGLVDAPNERRTHAEPTARGIGAALALAPAAAATTLNLLGYLSPIRLTICLLAALAIGGIGLADDVLGLRVSTRLCVHFLVATVIAVLAVLNFSGRDPVSFSIMLSGTILTLVWGLNLFNFMDGIDGLALQETIFLGLGAIALLANSDSQWPPLLLGIVSGAIVTLRWNWAPARAFLGDVGSGFLGVIFAAITVDTVVSGHIEIESWLILWGVFLVDSTVTLVTRITSGQLPVTSYELRIL